MPKIEDFTYLLTARQINARFDKVDVYENRAREAGAADQSKADEFYISAGHMLLTEREKFPLKGNGNRPGWYRG